MLKIIIFFEGEVTSGGGYNQALNAILQMIEICNNKFSLEIITTKRSAEKYFLSLGITSFYFKYSSFDKIYRWLAKISLLNYIFNKLEITSFFESICINNKCDLIYFVSPSVFAINIKKINYIATIWDLCHIEYPEFPEVKYFDENINRNLFYERYLSNAALVITDSDELSQLVELIYKVHFSKIISMPFSVAMYIKDADSVGHERLLSKYNLNPGYFFYPAQYWPHKNHIRIIQALIHIKKLNKKIPTIVFCGQDYGNLAYLKNIAIKNKLEKFIHFLDFLPADDVKMLYQNCKAVIMPTYFGPTNLPPFEAWALSKPLIYSEHLVGQVGDGALCIDPNSAEDIAHAIERIEHDESLRKVLIKNGKIRLNYFLKMRSSAEEKIEFFLNKFSKIRECWN